MATTENDVLMSNIDGDGNVNLIYPVTKVKNVIGGADVDTYTTTLTAAEFEALTTAEKIALFESGVRVVAVDSDLNPDSMTDMQRFAAFAHPVGEIVHLTIETNPATLWGFGTWEAIAAGRVLVGAGTADSGTVYEAGATGGEETYRLTTKQLPNEDAYVAYFNEAWSATQSSETTPIDARGSAAVWGGYKTEGILDNRFRTAYSAKKYGDGEAIDNMQPYYVCHMWLRTA